MAQALQRHFATGEMYRNQPSTNQVDNVMQCVCVRHAINCSVDGECEEEDANDVSSPGCDARDHFATGERFNED